jgi:transposase
MRPYPKELRTRVVAAVEQGERTIEEVAAVFSVGMTFVKKMLRLQRAGEDLAPRHGGGSAPQLTDSDRALLRDTVARAPDVTLAECQSILRAQAKRRVSGPTICRALQQLGLPRKKKSARQGARRTGARHIPHPHGGVRYPEVSLY